MFPHTTLIWDLFSNTALGTHVRSEERRVPSAVLLN